MQVQYKPAHRLVIHEIHKHDQESFIEIATSNAPMGTVVLIFWCDDIAFTYVPMPQTISVLDEQLEGVLHWQAVNYCDMMGFQKTINAKNGVMIMMLKADDSLFQDVAKFLKGLR